METYIIYRYSHGQRSERADVRPASLDRDVDLLAESARHQSLFVLELAFHKSSSSLVLPAVASESKGLEKYSSTLPHESLMTA